MSSKNSLLKSSLDILNSTYLFILLCFFLNSAIVWNLADTLSDPLAFLFELDTFSLTKSYIFFLASVLRKISLLLLIAAKMVIYSGIYGSLLELVSGEEITLSIRNFLKNVRSFLPFYFVFTMFSLLINKAFIKFFSGNTLLIKLLVPFILEVFMLFILTYILIFIKYLRPLKLSFRKECFNLKHFLFVIGLLAVNTIVVNLPAFIGFNKIMAVRFSLLISVCIHFLAFIYMSMFIIKEHPELKNKYEFDKELFLINPLWAGAVMGEISAFISLYPPIFILLQSLTDKAYKIRKFNKTIWRKRYYKKNKLVAITCFSSNSYRAYKIAKEFKRAGSTVIMGGPHVTYCPDEALEYCDSVVIGEAEKVWSEVVKDYENNCLKRKYFGYSTPDFHQEAHKELMSSDPSIVKYFLETTRGCKFNCEFCSIPPLSRGKIFHKPVDDIVELIKKIRHRYKELVFLDSNIFTDSLYSKELFRKLIPLKIKWISFCSIDIAKDEEALALVSQSGCKMLAIGYEITPQSLEKGKGGKLRFASDYIDLTKKIKKAGIRIKAHLIFGFDHDNFRSFIQLWKFCFKIYPYFVSFSLLTPLPGTRLYHRLLKENRITTLNWRYYDNLNLTFKHRYLKGLWLVLAFNFMKYLFPFTTSLFGRFLFLLLVVIICFKL